MQMFSLSRYTGAMKIRQITIRRIAILLKICSVKLPFYQKFVLSNLCFLQKFDPSN